MQHWSLNFCVSNLKTFNTCRLGEIQIYKLRRHQKFQHMFEEVAKRNNVAVEDVLIDMYYKFVEPNDTPHSIGLESFHTLSEFQQH